MPSIAWFGQHSWQTRAFLHDMWRERSLYDTWYSIVALARNSCSRVFDVCNCRQIVCIGWRALQATPKESLFYFGVCRFGNSRTKQWQSLVGCANAQSSPQVRLHLLRWLLECLDRSRTTNTTLVGCASLTYSTLLDRGRDLTIQRH